MRTSFSRAAAHRSKVNEPSIDFDEDCSGEVTPRSGTHPEETTPDHTSCSTDELVLQMLHLSRNVAPLRNPLNIPRPRLIVLIQVKSVSTRPNSKSHVTGTYQLFQKETRVQDQARAVESDRTRRVPCRLAQQGDNVHRGRPGSSTRFTGQEITQGLVGCRVELDS